MLNIWPAELPVYIYGSSHPSKEAIDNVVAALKLNHRVSVICLQNTSTPAWETFASLMEHPFPELTHLSIMPFIPMRNVVPSAFLGRSAPCLRDLSLIGIPFPALPELLLSATDLVRLQYDNVPHCGYISPQATVTSLSVLTRLESLSLTFPLPQDLPDRAIRISPPHTRTLLPALTYLCLRGVPEYMEDLVSQIDAPLLEGIEITLFHQEVLEVSQLAKFICRVDSLSLIDRAEISFHDDSISVKLSQELQLPGIDPKTLKINLDCYEMNLRLSYLAQFCASFLPTLSPFECLHILVQCRCIPWRRVVDNPDPQWLELLRLFNAVKDLRLDEIVAPHAAPVLGRLPAEQVSEVLPALEIVFISGLNPFGPVKEAISEFTDARQLSGRPVSIYTWEQTML